MCKAVPKSKSLQVASTSTRRDREGSYYTLSTFREFKTVLKTEVEVYTAGYLPVKDRNIEGNFNNLILGFYTFTNKR